MGFKDVLNDILIKNGFQDIDQYEPEDLENLILPTIQRRASMLMMQIKTCHTQMLKEEELLK